MTISILTATTNPNMHYQRAHFLIYTSKKTLNYKAIFLLINNFWSFSRKNWCYSLNIVSCCQITTHHKLMSFLATNTVFQNLFLFALTGKSIILRTYRLVFRNRKKHLFDWIRLNKLLELEFSSIDKTQSDYGRYSWNVLFLAMGFFMFWIGR